MTMFPKIFVTFVGAQGLIVLFLFVVLNIGVFFTVFVPFVDFYSYMQISSFPIGFKETKLWRCISCSKKVNGKKSQSLVFFEVLFNRNSPPCNKKSSLTRGDGGPFSMTIFEVG